MSVATETPTGAAPRTPVVGAPVGRIEGRDKVTGAARYAGEQRIEHPAYGFIVQSTIARGEISSVDDRIARAVPGVVAVLWHGNAPRLHPADDAELMVLQSPAVSYRGQPVALVVADRLETARTAAALVEIEYDAQPHHVELEGADVYRPDKVNAGYETDSEMGDVDQALADAAVSIDATYRTPPEHANPMEPHATLAAWDDDGAGVTLYDSTQGAHSVLDAVAQVFRLEPDRVRVVAEHIGGGFGSKGLPHAQVVLAVMAARVAGRPVKLPVTRQQMFAFVGYRTPTIQRVRLGAGADRRLVALSHEVIEQTSTMKEFAEQTAVPSRVMYAAPNRRTTHRLARLDVPPPSWVRGPGETPGMYALESAMDELAIACGMDPVELRIRNEPALDPERGVPFSSRGLVACLRQGAARFGWAGREPTPRARRDGAWLIGTGVAASTYPAYLRPSSATARVDPNDGFVVRVDGTDIGTGARTALTQLAADALHVPIERVRVEIGDSRLPRARVAGGSSGTSSWGTAVVMACRQLLEQLVQLEHQHGQGGAVPPDGLEVSVDTDDVIGGRPDLAYHGFGAQFVEARVNVDTGEVRVPRLVGVFAVGRIVNPITARSQLIGGMTMGVSMALHEESVLDPHFGDYVNHDLAMYEIATCADVVDIDVSWLVEDDPHVNPMGTKGIGEIGTVGTAAAVANAVHHATGIRVRDLPIRLDKLLG